MSESQDRMPWVLGCLTGVGCGVMLLVMCLSGFFFYSTTATTASPSPAVSPYPPAYPPPSVPVAPPPSLPAPPVLPPPAIPPPGALAPPSDAAPRLVRATITEVSGESVGVTVGATCEFNVERQDAPDGSFACNAQIVCGGRLLYGGPSAGYFQCTLYEGPPRHVVGSDLSTTGGDHDGAMSLDTHSVLELWDDASGPNGEFRVTARVDSVE